MDHLCETQSNTKSLCCKHSVSLSETHIVTACRARHVFAISDFTHERYYFAQGHVFHKLFITACFVVLYSTTFVDDVHSTQGSLVLN